MESLFPFVLFNLYFLTEHHLMFPFVLLDLYFIRQHLVESPLFPFVFLDLYFTRGKSCGKSAVTRLFVRNLFFCYDMFCELSINSVSKQHDDGLYVSVIMIFVVNVVQHFFNTELLTSGINSYL